MAEEKIQANENICKELIIKLDMKPELGVEDSVHMWKVAWEWGQGSIGKGMLG